MHRCGQQGAVYCVCKVDRASKILMVTVDANSLTKAIKDTLLCMNIPQSHCRGQCDDGASSRSGSKSEVVTQIAKEEQETCISTALGMPSTWMLQILSKMS